MLCMSKGLKLGSLIIRPSVELWGASVFWWDVSKGKTTLLLPLPPRPATPSSIDRNPCYVFAAKSPPPTLVDWDTGADGIQHLLCLTLSFFKKDIVVDLKDNDYNCLGCSKLKARSLELYLRFPHGWQQPYSETTIHYLARNIQWVEPEVEQPGLNSHSYGMPATLGVA